MKRVYLAGPISGQMYDQATDWREQCHQTLGQWDVEVLSPMRGKADLKSDVPIEGGYRDHPFAGERAIITRDRFDVTSADVILMNLLPMGDRISIGTFIELGWADACRTPVVMVRSSECKSHHPMVDQLIGFEVTTVDAALNTIKTLLCLNKK